jgi:hypothetical protein
MHKLWEPIANSAAADWHHRWEQAKRNAGLTNIEPLSYQRLMDKVPEMAQQLAIELEGRVSGQLGNCLDAQSLLDPQEADNYLFGGLRRSIHNSLTQLVPKNWQQSRMLRDVAVVRYEDADRLVTAIAQRVAVSIGLRAEVLKNQRNAQTESQRLARQSHKLNMVLLWIRIAAATGVSASTILLAAKQTTWGAIVGAASIVVIAFWMVMRYFIKNDDHNDIVS